MNVENSKEADPLRAAAVVGPARAADINVALILSCIRARRAKRRMHQSTGGEVIVDWVSGCRLVPRYASTLSERSSVTEKEA
jgi:hypothetical protein